MRPKIVILIIVVAIGVVALAAVLKGVMGGHAPQEAMAPEPPPEEPANGNLSVAVPQVNPNSSNTAAIQDKLRAAELASAMDQVRDLQAQGPSDPATADLLLAKVTHKEPEVRKAAVEALVQLDATNAIPGLEQALGLTQDPQDKIALLQAINYLKLPAETAPPPWVKPPGPGDEAPPPADFTAVQKRDPTVPRTPRERKARPRRDAVPPAAPGGTQPVAPVPDAAPPQ
jgi:hypothetical protein